METTQSSAASITAAVRASLSFSPRSTRRRSMNCPTRPPTAAIIASSGPSGGRTSRLRNSITPATSPRTGTGKATAPCNPSRAAAWRRGKLSARVTSAIHAGSADAHTPPGRPSPLGNVTPRLRALNSAAPAPSTGQTSTHLSASRVRSTSHSAAHSHPVFRQTAPRTPGAASRRDDASDNTRATACSVASRRSASLRSVTSIVTPSMCVGRPPSSRRTSPRPAIQQTVPSGRRTRYSLSYRPSPSIARRTAPSTASRSSGWTISKNAWWVAANDPGGRPNSAACRSDQKSSPVSRSRSHVPIRAASSASPRRASPVGGAGRWPFVLSGSFPCRMGRASVPITPTILAAKPVRGRAGRGRAGVSVKFFCVRPPDHSSPLV